MLNKFMFPKISLSILINIHETFNTTSTRIDCGICSAILWSSGGLLIKLVTLTPMQISFFRCSVTAIAYAFFSF
jgi:ribosomal protein S27E